MWQRGGTAHVRRSRVTSGSANVLAKPAGGILLGTNYTTKEAMSQSLR